MSQEYTKQEVVQDITNILLKLNKQNYQHMCTDEGITPNPTDFSNYGITHNQVENMLTMFLDDIVEDLGTQQHNLSTLLF